MVELCCLSSRPNNIFASHNSTYLDISSLLHYLFLKSKMAVASKVVAKPPSTYEGKPIKILSLETIHFSRLLSQEPDELARLLKLCETEGFFYLDLQDIDGRIILDGLQDLLAVMRRFFNSSHEAKNEIGLPSQEHGYVLILDILPSLIEND